MVTAPAIMEHLSDRLHTYGVSPAKVESACNVLEAVHADLLDLRSEVYMLNERLIKNNLIIEHIVASLCT
jgi:hypothetical protein